VSGRASGFKNGGMAEVGAPISQDGMAVHPDCWCICLCYLHFAPENPEHGEIYLLVPGSPGCPRQSPESRKMLLFVGVCVCLCVSQMFYLGTKLAGSYHMNIHWFCVCITVCYACH